MKSVNKLQVVTIRLTKQERRDIKKAALVTSRARGALVRPATLVREEAMKGIRAILGNGNAAAT